MFGLPSATKSEVKVDTEFESYVSLITLIVEVTKTLQDSKIKRNGHIPGCPCEAGNEAFSRLLELVPTELVRASFTETCPNLVVNLEKIIEDTLGLSPDQSAKFVTALIRR